MTRLRRSAAGRYAYDFVKAYLLLFILIPVVVGGIWVYTNYGPHTPTPQENWTRIENAWMNKREGARAGVQAAYNNFDAQIQAYEDYRDATWGWMNDLYSVPDWNDPKKSESENAEIAQEMRALIQAGQDEVYVLEQVVNCQTSTEVLALGQQVVDAESTFNTQFSIVRFDLMGSAQYMITPGPSLALPNPSLTPLETASGSPDASSSSSAGASGSTAPNASTSGSAGASASP